MGGGEYSEGEGEGDGEGYGGERVEGVSERKRGERGGRGEMGGEREQREEAGEGLAAVLSSDDPSLSRSRTRTIPLISLP